MRSLLCLLALCTLALGACESPDSQTYDPVLDEAPLGDADLPEVPDKPDDEDEGEAFSTPVVRYACAGGETFLLSLSPDRSTAAAVVGDSQEPLLMVRTGETAYRDTAGTATAEVNGDRVSLVLDRARAYRNCARQDEVSG